MLIGRGYARDVKLLRCLVHWPALDRTCHSVMAVVHHFILHSSRDFVRLLPYEAVRHLRLLDSHVRLHWRWRTLQWCGILRIMLLKVLGRQRYWRRWSSDLRVHLVCEWHKLLDRTRLQWRLVVTV